MKTPVILFVLSFFMPFGAKAQQIHHYMCSDNTTQEEMNICVAKNFKIAQQVLDSVYQDALNRLSYRTFEGKTDTDFVSRKALIHSQDAWLKYRDYVTNLILDQYDNGSAGGAVAWTYKTKLTLDRIRELTFLVHSRALYSKPDWNWKPLQK